MKLAVVVQRYGPAVHGGAERHARYLAEHLTEHADVDVLTTCASSDATWINEFSEGSETTNGVQVRRFRVPSPASSSTRARLTRRVFSQTHSLGDELKWLESNAPTSRPLLRYLRKNRESYDFCIFVGYRCGHAYYGAQAVGSRAVLVPRAEREPSIGARIFNGLFQSVRGILFDSPEERSLVQTLAGNSGVPNVVVGVGADVTHNPQPARFRHKRNIQGPFAAYVGRVDDGRCEELLRFFDRYSKEQGSRLSLVLVGDGELTIDGNQKLKQVGSLDDTEKFDAMAGADVLIVPSPSQNFSQTTIEAWTLGRPVLVNGASSGLRGLCGRSNGGLWYRNQDEFTAMLQALERNRWLSASLGRNGRQYVRDNYDWRNVGRKYHDLLAQLKNTDTGRDALPTPSWLSRLRRDVPAAAELVRSSA